MNRRERLMASIRGDPVDRPPVSFYEINGLDEDPDDPDPFNIHSDSSWLPLIELAREKTDRIVMRGLAFSDVLPDPLEKIAQEKTYLDGGSRIHVRTIEVGDRVLTSRTRRDRDLDTVWTVEHLLKGVGDLETYLQIPPMEVGGAPDPSPLFEAEEALGDSGIVMIDNHSSKNFLYK